METNLFTALIAEQHSIARTIDRFTALQVVVLGLLFCACTLAILHLVCYGIHWPLCVSEPLKRWRCHVFHYHAWIYDGKAYEPIQPGSKTYWICIRIRCMRCRREFTMRADATRFFRV